MLGALRPRRRRSPASTATATSRRPASRHTELFSRDVGRDERRRDEGDVHVRRPKGGRSLTLRPEGTAPVMRAYLGRDAGAAARRSRRTTSRGCSGMARPQEGRYREHRQFGIEVFGTEAPGRRRRGDRAGRRVPARPRADADRAAAELDRRRGLPSRLPRRAGGVPRAQPGPPRPTSTKTGSRTTRSACSTARTTACRAVAREAPTITDHLCEPCQAHFDGVQAGLEDAGLSWTIEPTLVRGLDYYTRTAFEFVSPGLSPQQATLFGGGRYDGLAEVLGGPHVPGVGFGMGLERVLLALEQEGSPRPRSRGSPCFVVGVGDAGRDEGARLVRRAPRGRRRRRRRRSRIVR